MTPRERPIIFAGESVRAILEGRKSVTRRVVKPQPHASTDIVLLERFDDGDFWLPYSYESGPSCERVHVPNGDFIRCPYGAAGERLWCREAWAWSGDESIPASERIERGEVWYRATPLGDPRGVNWRSPMFMPRFSSRITLEIVSVRVERVQDISEADAIAEGVRCWVCGGAVDGTSDNECGCFHSRATARASFEVGWDRINGRKPGCAWADNPFTWCITFRRVE